MGMMKDEIIMLAKLITDNSISSCLMLGVQSLLASLNDIESGFIKFSVNYNVLKYEKLKLKYNVTAVDVLSTLHGITKVDALDFSDYEGANIIYDLNNNPDCCMIKQKYDLVIDGGTLEHVYNVQNAINNMNAFVKNKGYIYHLLPCAGWVNHGFYSFSPCFFVDTYKEKSGFMLDECKLCFKQPKGQKDRLLFSSDCRFLNNTEINTIIRDNMTDGGVLLQCLAHKLDDMEQTCEPIQSVYKNDLWKKKPLQTFNEEKLISNIKECCGTVYMYGAGYWCNRIINILIMNNCYDAVAGIFDSDVNKAEKLIRGKKVLYPSVKTLRAAERIVVSSYEYEDEIYNRIISSGVKKSQIIRLSDLM